jgi:hypothetical protein
MNATASLFENNRSIAIMLASILMAILFGLIATTANLLVISIVAALFIGVLLLSRPVWIVWAILSVGLLVVGIAPLYDVSFDPKSGWPISVLCLIMMLVAFFKVATTPGTQKNTPAFIWLLLVFFVYAVLNSLVQWYSAEEFIQGFKHYFQTWGLLFALCWIAFDERHIRHWLIFFLIIALVQLPLAIYERIALVPLREGMRGILPGMVPIDIVAGTFGSNIYGGGASGEMSTFLVIIIAFLLARKMQKTLSIGHFILLSLWILSPLFLGETKAVIIMLPLMLFALYRRELLAKPHYGLIMLIIGTLLTVCMGYTYISIMQMSPDELFADTLNYNLYEKGYGTNYLNRTTVLTFWANQQGTHDPISFMFGNGLGSSHQTTGGHVDIRYPHYGIGLTAASTLLWDTGVFGCVLFASIFVLAWHAAGRLHRESTMPTVKADATAIQAALLLFVFHLFYKLTLLDNVSFQIVFAAVLGYLAWLHRRHVTPMSGSRV